MNAAQKAYLYVGVAAMYASPNQVEVKKFDPPAVEPDLFDQKLRDLGIDTDALVRLFRTALLSLLTDAVAQYVGVLTLTSESVFSDIRNAIRLAIIKSAT